VNRDLAIGTGALLLFAGIDYLSGSGLGPGEPALFRLALPCAVLAVFVGALAAWRGWLLAAGGVGVYGLLQILSSASHSLAPDWSYGALPVVAGLMAGLGTSLRRAYAERIAARLCREHFLSTEPADRAPELPREVLRLLHVDRSVLTIPGLVSAMLREEAEARQRGRFFAYGMVLCLIALYYVTGWLWALWVGLGVLLAMALGAAQRFVLSARPPLAFDSLLAGYYELAALEFAEALRINERDTKARIGLAIAHFHLKAYDKAIAQLEAARQMAFERFTVGVWVGVEKLLGLALREANKPSLAARALRNVLAIFPDDAQTLYDLALCYRKSGLERRARELFERAARLGHREAASLLHEGRTMAVAADKGSDNPGGSL